MQGEEILKNDTKFRWIDMFDKKVLTIKEIKEKDSCRDISRGELLNISLENETDKKALSILKH